MNLLIGLVLVFCLIVSETAGSKSVSDVGFRLLIVTLATMSVPILAVFQTMRVAGRLQEMEEPHKQAILRNLSVCHTVVWMCASLCIICAVQWQNIVRGNWHLDRWPLLDEILIVFPVVFALVASWAVFYDIQNRRKSEAGFWNYVFDVERLSHVKLKSRVYLLLSLIPLCIAVCLKDILFGFDIQSPALTLAICGLFLAIFLVLFPVILSQIWNTGDLPKGELQLELDRLCKQQNIGVRKIRLWNTGDRIINAVVAGFLPGCRVIFVTDAMINRFHRSELVAILRHEFSHVRLNHLLLRLLFVCWPVLVLSLLHVLGLQPFDRLQLWFQFIGLGSGTQILLPLTIGYVGYVLAIVAWISKRLEFEADVDSVTLNGAVDRDYALALQRSLIRFSSFLPNQVERATVYHPSLIQRISLIQKLLDHPNELPEFWRTGLRNKLTVSLILGAITVVSLAF